MNLQMNTGIKEVIDKYCSFMPVEIYVENADAGEQHQDRSPRMKFLTQIRSWMTIVEEVSDMRR